MHVKCPTFSKKKNTDDLSIHFLFAIKMQTVSNACGTVALLHSVGNSTDAFGLKDDSVLGGYYQSTKDLGAAEKAKFLETCQSVAELHKNHAQALLNSTEVSR